MSRGPHFKTVTITMYMTDIEQLDAQVRELKQRGWRAANKSQLIRIALDQVDLDDVMLRVLRARG